MTPELKSKWLAALRSGKYPQTRGRLYRDKVGPYATVTPGHCALGLLCEVGGLKKRKALLDIWEYISPNGDPRSSRAPIEWLPGHQQNIISIMNDHQQKSFTEIADWIEDNV